MNDKMSDVQQINVNIRPPLKWLKKKQGPPRLTKYFHIQTLTEAVLSLVEYAT